MPFRQTLHTQIMAEQLGIVVAALTAGAVHDARASERREVRDTYSRLYILVKDRLRSTGSEKVLERHAVDSANWSDTLTRELQAANAGDNDEDVESVALELLGLLGAEIPEILRDGYDPTDAWRFSASNAIPVITPGRRNGMADGYRRQYVLDARLGVAHARRRYHIYMRWFWVFRIGVIVAGALVAVLSAASAPQWIAGACGALAASLESVIVATRLQEKALAHGALSEGIARQLREYELGIGKYSSGDSRVKLYEAVEALREKAASVRFHLDPPTPGSKTGGGS